MRGLPYIARISGAGVLRPKHPILGGDIAGEVEAVGSGVTRFRPGDDVFGFIGFGGYAEFVAAPEAALAPKPVSLTFDEAATVPLSGVTALQGLRDAGDVQAGQQVLIIGASGGVGTFAVQIAKSFGATVTGVASTRSLDLVRSIGADHVLDYTQTDVTRLSERYDLVLQLAGTASARALRRILTPKGTLVLSSGDSSGRIIGPMGRVLAAVALKPFVSQRLRPLVHKPTSRRPRRPARADRRRKRPAGHRAHVLLRRDRGRDPPRRDRAAAGQGRHPRGVGDREHDGRIGRVGSARPADVAGRLTAGAGALARPHRPSGASTPDGRPDELDGRQAAASARSAARGSRRETPDQVPMEDEEQEQRRNDHDRQAGKRQPVVGGVERREAGQRELDREGLRPLEQHQRRRRSRSR